MANLNTKTISAGVGDILAVDGGIDTSSARQVKDGDGTGSPFYITTTKVGIAEPTPAYHLDIGNPAVDEDVWVRIKCDSGAGNNKAGILLSAETTAQWYMYQDDGDGNKLIFEDRGSVKNLCIQQDGKVGIGTASPDSTLEISSSDDTRVKITDTGDSSELLLRADGGNTSIYTNTNHDLNLFTNGNANQLFLKQSNGCVGIGTNSPTTEASANVFLEIVKASGIAGLGLNGGGASRWELTSDTGDDLKFSRNGTARLTADGATGVVSGDLNDTSDVNRKQKIETLSEGLSIVNQLRPVTFEWKDTKREAQGFIAQEIEKILPHCVTGEDYVDVSSDDDSTPNLGKSINVTGIVANLTKAIQELSAKVTALENK